MGCRLNDAAFIAGALQLTLGAVDILMQRPVNLSLAFIPCVFSHFCFSKCLILTFLICMQRVPNVQPEVLYWKNGFMGVGSSIPLLSPEFVRCAHCQRAQGFKINLLYWLLLLFSNGVG